MQVGKKLIHLVRRRCLPNTGRHRVVHQTAVRVLVAEQVAQLVHHDRQQVHAVLLARIAGRSGLGIVPRGLVQEPAPAGLRRGEEGECGAAEVRAMRDG